MTADDTLAAGIAAWLPAARWNRAPPGSTGRITIAASATLADGTTVALVDATAGAATDRYVVPVDGSGRDAAVSPAFARWIVESAIGGAITAGRGGSFVGHAVDSETHAPPGDCEVAPIGADASNTSLRVRLGTTTVVVKLVRRCREGVQPEVELGAFFARQAPWDGTPRLLGWVEHVPHDPPAVPTVVATVHEHLPGRRAAWDHLLALVGAGALETPATHRNRRRVLALAEDVGRVTAAMHVALASRADLPDFAPQRPTDESCRRIQAGLVIHARHVLDRIAAPPAHVTQDIARRLEALAAAGPRLEHRMLTAATSLADGAFIRVHGDYHLGQVLAAEDSAGWRTAVIDFEGEPGRTLAERRQKVPAAKDVAGMCRSFDYLLRCAELAGGPLFDADRLRLLETSFLDAYIAIASGHPWWPSRASSLLEAYRIDKAIYELDYEIDHRPDWVGVPLAALEATLGTS